MGYIEGEDRRQMRLLPDCIDDLVEADNPVRAIDAFVDGLCLEVLGFQKAAPADTGRPAYDPRDLLKLYIYGYFNKIRSSRKLMKECRRNIEIFFLLNRLTRGTACDRCSNDSEMYKGRSPSCVLRKLRYAVGHTEGQQNGE